MPGNLTEPDMKRCTALRTYLSSYIIYGYIDSPVLLVLVADVLGTIPIESLWRTSLTKRCLGVLGALVLTVQRIP